MASNSPPARWVTDNKFRLISKVSIVFSSLACIFVGVDLVRGIIRSLDFPEPFTNDYIKVILAVITLLVVLGSIAVVNVKTLKKISRHQEMKTFTVKLLKMINITTIVLVFLYFAWNFLGVIAILMHSQAG